MAAPPSSAAATPHAGPLDPRQRSVAFAEMHNSALDGRQAQIHTAMPGHVVAYNPATMTVEVQPGIKAVHRKIDGTKEMVEIATIADVPVMFPGGGAHTLTFPISKGDECLLVFAERSIDNWFQHGGTQNPSDHRMHDINDCIAIVGLRSKPAVLGAGGGAPQASPDTVTLRSDDGKTVVQIDGKTHAITLYAAGGSTERAAGAEAVVFVDGANNDVTIQTGNTVNITAPTVTITGEVHVTGELWAHYKSGPVSVTQHIHKAINQPPNVGTMREGEGEP